MYEAILYTARWEAVPVYGPDDVIKRRSIEGLTPIVGTDEFVHHQDVVTHDIPLTRFVCNGSEHLVAFDESLKDFLLAHNEKTEREMQDLRMRAHLFEQSARELDDSLDRYRGLWNRLRNLFREPCARQCPIRTTSMR